MLTDNKSLTRFIKAESIPASLLNNVDRVKLVNQVVSQIPGKASNAADLLSCWQSDPSETIELKLLDKTESEE